MFIKISPSFLKEIATNNERIPTLYYHPVAFVSDFFWARLKIAEKIICQYLGKRDNVLDFGCGAGIFLPSLSSLFKNVTAVDLEAREAKKIIEKYRLSNVTFKAGDVADLDVPAHSQDAIVAMDVLEHFKVLDLPVKKIKEWLSADGFLITSLPTENIFTVLSRILGRQAKPFDHYHAGREVETFLVKSGFTLVKRKILSPFAPMYLISLWKLKI